MENSEIELIEAGRDLLYNKQFPGEIIESVKDKRKRRRVSSGIFANDLKLEHIRPEEKKWRSVLLQVQFAFTDYLSSKEKMIPAGAILLVIGFLAASTGFVKMHLNEMHGVVTMIEGAVIVIFGMRMNRTVEYLNYLLIALGVGLILQLLILGFPRTFMEFMYYSEHFDTALRYQPAGGSMMIMLNESTPYFYLVLKLAAFYLVVRLYFNRRVYLKRRAVFEQLQD